MPDAPTKSSPKPTVSRERGTEQVIIERGGYQPTLPGPSTPPTSAPTSEDGGGGTESSSDDGGATESSSESGGGTESSSDSGGGGSESSSESGKE